MVQKWNNLGLELDIVLCLLKYGELHLRGLAKATGHPHSTLSRVIKKMVKKNLVDFKREGKNKIFNLKKGIETINYVYLAEHYRLVRLIDKYPNMAVIIETITKKTDEKLILLFGSYAKFNAKPDSDIDLFVETKNRNVKRTVDEINSKINTKIGDFEKSNPLVKEIIKDHVIIKGVETYYEKNSIFA